MLVKKILAVVKPRDTAEQPVVVRIAERIGAELELFVAHNAIVETGPAAKVPRDETIVKKAAASDARAA